MSPDVGFSESGQDIAGYYSPIQEEMEKSYFDMKVILT